MHEMGRQSERQTIRPEDMSTLEIAGYIAEMLGALRALTQRPTRISGQELVFLDYLIAIAEDEAKILATRSYN